MERERERKKNESIQLLLYSLKPVKSIQVEFNKSGRRESLNPRIEHAQNNNNISIDTD